MKERSIVCLLVLSVMIGCTKQGKDGFNSVIAIQDFLSSSSCPSGGLAVKSGLDLNRNNILDSNEVTSTKSLCNGQSSTSDKQIFLPINYSVNTTSTTPFIGGELVKFSKRNYPNVDSIILVANPYVADVSNSAILELYNITDSVPVNNSIITTSNLHGTSPPFLQSANVYNSLPDKEITLGIRFRSGNQGKFAASGHPYLILYRK
jgi:hypothetical protein